MSPVGAQGINVALRDAVVAANHFVPVLQKADAAAELDAAADAFYNERIKEVSVTQWVQRRIPLLLLGRGIWIDATMAGVRGLSSWGLLQRLVDARTRRPNPMIDGFSEIRLRVWFLSRTGLSKHARVEFDLPDEPEPFPKTSYPNAAVLVRGLIYGPGVTSLDGSALRSLAGQVGRPVVHQLPSALEQVRAPIGCLDPVLYHMRQGGLDDLAGMIRLLGRPVPETRPEPVRHSRDLELPEQFRQRRVREWLSVHARKHERTVATERPSHLEDLQSTPAQRDPVLTRSRAAFVRGAGMIHAPSS